MESLSEDAFFYDRCASSCRLCLHTAAIALVGAKKPLLTLMCAHGLVQAQQFLGDVRLFVSPDTTDSEVEHIGEIFTTFSVCTFPLFGQVFSSASSFIQTYSHAQENGLLEHPFLVLCACWRWL